jgi:nucleoside-triphosphatase THEP1
MGKMSREHASFAAVVYDEGVAVDLLLAIFAQQLGAQGTRIGGVLHTHASEAHCGPLNPLRLRDVRTGRIIGLCRRDTASSKGCTMSMEQLGEATRVVENAIMDRSELVFVSRFGRLERRGQGFASALTRARFARTPVLTAVRREHADAWFAHNHGLGLLLEPRLWLLSAWWNELVQPESTAQRAMRFCNTSK